MNIKHFFLMILVSVMLPGMVWGQAKPKRDTTKDIKQVVRKTQEKSNTTTPTPSKTQGHKTSKAKSNNYFTISSDEVCFESKGGTHFFSVSSNKPWEIITDTYEWGHLSKTDNGLKLLVDENRTSAERIDYFEIGSGNKVITVYVKQAGANIFEVSTEQLSFPSSGGSKSITVSASAPWDINVRPNSWGHLTKNGNSLVIVVDENKTTSQRNDYFMIKSGEKTIRINITQAKANSLSVSKEELTFASSGGSQTISVYSSESWNVGTGPYKWGHLSRNGNQLTLTVDANISGDRRTDFFTIKSGNIVKRINVLQEGSFQNSYTSHPTNRNFVNQYKKNWWEGRVTMGWNIVQAEGAEHIMSFRSGLRMRFGKHSDFFNFIIGGDYVYHTMMDRFTDFDFEELAQYVGANVNLRLNIIKLSRNCNMYIGCEGEYGFRLSGKKEYYDFTNANTISISPEMGFHFKKFDIGFNYRKYIDDYHLLKNYSTDEGCWGGHMVWYF